MSKKIGLFLMVFLFLLILKAYATAQDIININYSVSGGLIKFTFNTPSDFKQLSVVRNGQDKGNLNYVSGSPATATENDVADNQTYNYTFYVIDQAGEKSQGVNVTVKTGDVNPPPNVSVHFSPSDVSVKMDITLGSPVSDFSYYEISRDGKVIATTKNAEYQDTGLKGNTTYHYCIKSVDTGGLKSNCNSEMVTTLPYAVSNLDVNNITTDTFKITWDANGNPSNMYYVWDLYDANGLHESSGGAGSTGTNQTYFDMTSANNGNMKSGTEYRFDVKAVSSDGRSSYTKEIYFTTLSKTTLTPTTPAQNTNQNDNTKDMTANQNKNDSATTTENGTSQDENESDLDNTILNNIKSKETNKTNSQPTEKSQTTKNSSKTETKPTTNSNKMIPFAIFGCFAVAIAGIVILIKKW